MTQFDPFTPLLVTHAFFRFALHNCIASHNCRIVSESLNTFRHSDCAELFSNRDTSTDYEIGSKMAAMGFQEKVIVSVFR
jgi:hypothetical protein